MDETRIGTAFLDSLEHFNLIYLSLLIPLKERVATNEAMNTKIKMLLYGFPLSM